MRNSLKFACAPLIALLVFTSASCSRDPNVVKAKYLENGNRYFEKGKYKEALIMYRNALKKDPKYAEAYYRVGLTELRIRKPIDAARAFRRAADSDPKHQEARAQLGEIYLVAFLTRSPGWENIAPMIEDISKDLLKLNPKSAPALRMKGYLAMSDKNYEEAVAQFREADRITPHKQEIVLPLAEALYASNQPEEAEKVARALIAQNKTFGPIYDLLYLQAMRTNRPNEGEAVLKEKIGNNPKAVDYRLQLAQHYLALQRRDDMKQILAKTGSKEFADGRMKTGLFYFRVRDFDNAIKQFQAGLTEDAQRKSLYRRSIAETLVVQRKPVEAVRVLDEAIKEDPKDDQAHAMRAALLIESGNPQQVQAAVTDLQAMVSRAPTNAVMRFNLGRALLAKNDIEQARTQFQEAAKLQKDYTAPRLALAQLHIRRRDWGQALQYSNEVMQLDPRNLTARLIHSSALAATQDLTRARAELNVIVKEYPRSQEAQIQMGLLDMAGKDFKSAEARFEKLYTANPDDLRGLMGLAEVYASQQQYGKAIAILEKEIAKRPNRPQMRVALGNLAFRSGDFDLALEHFQALVKENPNAGDIYVRMGEIYRRKGQPKPAIQAFRKAIELRPNDPEPHLQLAMLIDADGNRAEARPYYEQVLKLQPDNPVALNNMAYMMTETGGDLDYALSLAQRAKQKMPSDPNVTDTLGWIYIKKNLSDNAIQVYRALVAQQPNRSIYRYHYAMALYQRGDKTSAKRELQAAIANLPSAIPGETPGKELKTKINELMAKL